MSILKAIFKIWVRLPFFFLLASLFLFWIFNIYRNSDDAFSLHAISTHRKYRSDWETHSLTPQEKADLKKALAQKYHYLACGQQAFAFLSEDGNYVLKFLKQKLFKTPRFWDKKKRWEKQNKLERDFASYRLAFDALQQETGLVFVHLNPSLDLPSELVVVDDHKKTHHLNPNNISFILQKRAELVYPTIDRLMAEGAVDEARQALDSILALFASRVRKGIADSDPDLDKNFGFIEGRAIQIDVGRFTNCSQITHYRDRDKKVERMISHVAFPPIKDSFWEWLSTHHPLLYEDFKRNYSKMNQEVFCD